MEDERVDELNPTNWILLPPGNKAIFRYPADEIPDYGRLATPEELFLANQGYEFPWGRSPSQDKSHRLWSEYRMGMGGLFFTAWYKTQAGRFGAAPNVPLTFPATLRYSLFIGGGACPEEELEDNEGFAVVRNLSGEEARVNMEMRRRVQVYASSHVAADGGSIIVSPLAENGVVYVGFVGRCLHCPNPELISIGALRHGVPQYRFELLPEWKNWSA